MELLERLHCEGDSSKVYKLVKAIYKLKKARCVNWLHQNWQFFIGIKDNYKFNRSQYVFLYEWGILYDNGVVCGMIFF